jgi:ribonuclease HI
MKDVNGNVVEHIDGIEVVFAYYIPGMTRNEQPPAAKKKKRMEPSPPQAKPIALKVTEMTTAEIIALPNIPRCEEAISSAVKWANIPGDWTVTIIENKADTIMVACASPSYGLITPQKYNELRRQDATALSAIPKPNQITRSVKVVVTYVHITPQRKLFRHTLNFRIEEDDDKQVILSKWVELARNEVNPWPQTARKMSLRADDYNWFTGSEDPLQFPWYDFEAIFFKDPPRSSTTIVEDDEGEPNGPSFGPGTGGSPDTQPSGSPQAPSKGVNMTSETAAGEGSSKGPTDALDYNTSTLHVPAGTRIDVTFKCMGRTVGASVLSNIKESGIQRFVANSLHVNLDGYWVATVTEGFGRIGALCREYTVTLTPATTQDIQRVAQARTSAAAITKPRKTKTHAPRKATPGTISHDWLAIQRAREQEVEWIKFGQELERDKMVHVVTDGGARPNPGAAGWGVLMRQSGKFAINWGHWDMATNNAMEILAVTEALANIPDGMHVWGMTDSAYVKNGITEWVSNWIRNGWKNTGGARVSNKSLWQKLMAAVNRMKRVEWSWVKAHNGRLLNEWADTLATRGVMGVPRPCPVATVRVVGEDVDSTVYEMNDGEETPVCGKDGEGYPVGKTYVLKAHATDIPFRGVQAGTQEESDALVQGIEECSRETRELSNRIIQAEEPETRDSEDESSFPVPEDSPESSSPQFATGEACMQQAQRMVKFWTAHLEWENRPRPEWWSQAWEDLAEVKRPDGTRIPTGSPKEFRECITGDVFAADSFNYEARVTEDSDPSVRPPPSVDPNLANVAAIAIWNETGTTMLRKCARDHDINDLALALLKDALSIVPDRCELTYATSSDWLLGQWNDMVQWQSILVLINGNTIGTPSLKILSKAK